MAALVESMFSVREKPWHGKSRSKDFHWKYYAVSKRMGHAKELITEDVYGDNQNIIPEEIYRDKYRNRYSEQMF